MSLRSTDVGRAPGVATMTNIVKHDEQALKQALIQEFG